MPPLQLYGLLTWPFNATLMNQCWHVTKDRDDSTVLRENLCPTDDLLQWQPTTGLHAGLIGPGLGSGLRKRGKGVDVRTGDFHGELTLPFFPKD